MTAKTASVLLLMLLFFCAASQAETPPIINGTITPIKSRIEGIISNTHQQHMWATEDGGICVLVAGTKNTENGLNAYCTHDGGGTWKNVCSTKKTANRPKADIFYDDSTLRVAYPGSNGNLMYQSFFYQQVSGKWTARDSLTLYSSKNNTADKATLTVDTQGRTWFTAKITNNKTKESLIGIGYLEGNKARILDRTLGTKNTSSRKSGRILTLSNGVGIVYTDGPNEKDSMYTLNWAYHLDEWPAETWIDKEIHKFSSADGEQDLDGVHYSAVTDSQDVAHIATTANGNTLYYFKIWGLDNFNSAPTPLGESKEYIKISTSSDDNVYIARAYKTNEYFQVIEIIQSSDHGASFQPKNELHYRPTENLGNPRLEMPSHVSSMIPLVRQIDLSPGIFGLVYFEDSLIQ